jgi:hypothetical protein
VSSTTKRRTPRRPCVNFPEDFVWSIPESPAFVAADGLIYCDDAVAVLRHVPDGSVDLILTDPPYGVNYRSSIDYHTLPPDRRGGPSITRGKSIEGDTPLQANYLFNILVLEASRLLKPGGCLCRFAIRSGEAPIRNLGPIVAGSHLWLISDVSSAESDAQLFS